MTGLIDSGIVWTAFGLLCITSRKPVAAWSARTAQRWFKSAVLERPERETPERYERLQLGAGAFVTVVGVALVIIGLIVR